MAFSFLKFYPFKVLGDQALGKEFLPQEAKKNDKACLISVRHGRAVTMKIDDLTWINVKGIGWTFGGPYVFRSRKDDMIMFGLMDEDDAKRELDVSRYLQKINPYAPKILGYKSFGASKTVLEHYDAIINIKHTNGKTVNPCVLYTQYKSPFRMSDIAFYNDTARAEILDFYSGYFKCAPSEYIYKFARKLAEQIGLYHAKGVINDSLYWDNITLCAEIVDYEWLTVPGMPLPNGQDAEHYIPDERKEKEIVYAIEAILRMAGLLQIKADFYRILDALIAGHRVHNPEFIEKSAFLTSMQNREKFIF